MQACKIPIVCQTAVSGFLPLNIFEIRSAKMISHRFLSCLLSVYSLRVFLAGFQLKGTIHLIWLSVKVIGRVQTDPYNSRYIIGEASPSFTGDLISQQTPWIFGFYYFSTITMIFPEPQIQVLCCRCVDWNLATQDHPFSVF